MSTNLSVVPSEAVSSAGNAWIICRSKSYAGRIYYFNTSTGETVWNLSEHEMQKAKAMTKIFKSQSGFQPDDCPEPVHPPEDDISQGHSTRIDYKHYKMSPAKIYNKQVINNQFTKPYSSQLPNYDVSNGIQLNIPVTPAFNGLWNIAPQPIFVAPAPVHLQQFANFNQVPITSTTVSLSNRFKNVSNKGPQNKVKCRCFRRNFKPKLNNNEPRKTYFKQKLQNNRKVKDLRHHISSRRSSFNNIDFNQPSGSTTFGNVRSANSNKYTLRENNYNVYHDDDMWLEENLQLQGKTDKIDATPLKSYFQIENSHLWYIIADSDTLLNNLNFLNILLNSDEHCRLIIPRIVMNIIEKATYSALTTPAHRAAYFISQQVDANLAFIVPHNEDEGSTDEKHCIITCCSDLMQQDNYVIILTDSMELNVLKDTGEMPILTISEIKEMLDNNSDERESIETPKVDSRNIKITIPNTNKTTPITPLEIKTDQVEVEARSEVTVPENDELNTNSSNRNPLNENVVKKKNLCKAQPKRSNSLDRSMKSANTITKISNFGSLPQSVDKIGRNENGKSIKNVQKISKKSSKIKEIKGNDISKDKSKDIESKDICNVMFEVTSQAMKNYLKVKSDEWVSRFIQIMEEVLAQILQQEPKFVLEDLPPPWTVYESTECIKRKFTFDSDIVDAATKLLNVLFDLGGLRGKIKNDLTPEKYMEMYSFGVYLIDALQGLLDNSEDLETAAESLSKLLTDILNPHLDPCNEDSFVDVHLESEKSPQDKKEINEDSGASESEKLEESVNSENRQVVNTPSTPKKDENVTPDCGKIYNLRSNKKKTVEDKQDVVFIQHLDIESSFFTSLELRKNADKGIFSKILSRDTQTENQDSLENNDQITKEKADDNEVANKKEPTFIKNVTKCIEFEEELKENSEVPYDSWTHRNEDYEELDYESLEEGYYMDGEYNYNEDLCECDDFDDSLKHSDGLESQDPPNDNNNIDFKWIVQKMQNNIKGTYSVVHEFCKKSYEKLSSTGIELDECDILFAEKTYLFIENLCNTFNRILERETSDSEFKIQEVFKNKQFEGVVITGKDLYDYRSFISNCLAQGNILKESVRLIIDASKET